MSPQLKRRNTKAFQPGAKQSESSQENFFSKEQPLISTDSWAQRQTPEVVELDSKMREELRRKRIFHQIFGDMIENQRQKMHRP